MRWRGSRSRAAAPLRGRRSPWRASVRLSPRIGGWRSRPPMIRACDHVRRSSPTVWRVSSAAPSCAAPTTGPRSSGRPPRSSSPRSSWTRTRRPTRSTASASARGSVNEPCLSRATWAMRSPRWRCAGTTPTRTVAGAASAYPPRRSGSAPRRARTTRATRGATRSRVIRASSRSCGCLRDAAAGPRSRGRSGAARRARGASTTWRATCGSGSRIITRAAMRHARARAARRASATIPAGSAAIPTRPAPRRAGSAPCAAARGGTASRTQRRRSAAASRARTPTRIASASGARDLSVTRSK